MPLTVGPADQQSGILFSATAAEPKDAGRQLRLIHDEPVTTPADAQLWTDGACSGNPGPGGWASLLRVRSTLTPPPADTTDPVAHYLTQLNGIRQRGLLVAAGAEETLTRNAAALTSNPQAPVRVWVERELSGGERRTTNNRMEIMGLLNGLRALSRPAAVTVHTDSRYLVDSFEKGWLANWQRNGWKTSANKPVANQDLWELALIQHAHHQISFQWVKGHARVELNERVDRLAVAARDRAGRG